MASGEGVPLLSLKKLESILYDQLKLDPQSRLVIAYSGGLDSSVLLHLLWRLSQQRPIQLTAAHFDHGIDPRSESWAEHCEQVVKTLDIDFVRGSRESAPLQGESQEMMARRLRYQWLRSEMGRGDALLTAHHLDDQAETILLHLMRGSGLQGLSGIPEFRSFDPGVLARPLLTVPHHEIEAYGKKWSLRWIEDPSNNTTQHDRNYIRHKIIPPLKQRWAAAAQQIGRSARNNAGSVAVLDDLARGDRDGCISPGPALFSNGRYCLDISRILSLGDDRAIHLLRFWVKDAHFSNIPGIRLNEFYRQLNSSGKGVCSWTGGEIRAYRGRLYLLSNPPSQGGPLPKWKFQSPLNIPCSSIRLIPEEAEGEGLALKWSSQATLFWRQGGERCHLPGRNHSQALKKVYQEANIPPWERQALPLIGVNGELAAIPGFITCQSFKAAPDERGVVIRIESSEML